MESDVNKVNILFPNLYYDAKRVRALELKFVNYGSKY